MIIVFVFCGVWMLHLSSLPRTVSLLLTCFLAQKCLSVSSMSSSTRWRSRSNISIIIKCRAGKFRSIKNFFSWLHSTLPAVCRWLCSPQLLCTSAKGMWLSDVRLHHASDRTSVNPRKLIAESVVQMTGIPLMTYAVLCVVGVCSPFGWHSFRLPQTKSL